MPESDEETEPQHVPDLFEKFEVLWEFYKRHRGRTSKAELLKATIDFGANRNELRKSAATKKSSGPSAAYFNNIRRRDEAALFEMFGFDETTPGWREGSVAEFEESVRRNCTIAAAPQSRRANIVSGSRTPLDVVEPYDVEIPDGRTLSKKSFALTAACHQFRIGTAASIYCEVLLGPLPEDRRLGFERCYLWLSLPKGMAAGQRLGQQRDSKVKEAIISAGAGYWLLEPAELGAALRGTYEIEEALFTVLGGKPGETLTLRLTVPPKEMVPLKSARQRGAEGEKDWSAAKKKIEKRLFGIEESMSWRRWEGLEDDEAVVALQEVHLVSPPCDEDDANG